MNQANENKAGIQPKCSACGRGITLNELEAGEYFYRATPSPSHECQECGMLAGSNHFEVNLKRPRRVRV